MLHFWMICPTDRAWQDLCNRSEELVDAFQQEVTTSEYLNTYKLYGVSFWVSTRQTDYKDMLATLGRYSKSIGKKKK